MTALPSYILEPASHPLIGETIGQNLYNTVQQYPNQDALVSLHQNYRATYQEFYDQTTQMAKAFLAKGLTLGDRVGIWAPNRFEWTLVQYATARVGLILVNLNPAYRKHEVLFAINQSDISFIVSAESYKTSIYKKMLDEISENCHSLKDTVYLDTEGWDQFLEAGNQVTDEDLLAAESVVEFDQPINIQYTSGTTGFPKGVTLSHHNILNNGFFIARRLNTQRKIAYVFPFLSTTVLGWL